MDTTKQTTQLTPSTQSWSVEEALVDDDGYFRHHQPIANGQIHHKSVCRSSQRAASEERMEEEEEEMESRVELSCLRGHIVLMVRMQAGSKGHRRRRVGALLEEHEEDKSVARKSHGHH